MSTSLILGAVGGVIGFFVGGPTGAAWGFALGSLAGSLLDPPKTQGPRLNDLKLQSATFGKMIPFFWGAGRIAGNIIDQTDLEEHSQKSGGKGGAETENFTYTVSVDVMIGSAKVFGEDAIIGIKKIWADARLIWSDDDGTPIPCTVYVGSETQLPDPTFEAIHGVGEVPAYRGYCHVVFTDMDTTPYFNRIPSFEFLVYTGAGDYPWQVNTGDPWNTLILNTNPVGFVVNGDGTFSVVAPHFYSVLGTPYLDINYYTFNIQTLAQAGSTVTTTINAGIQGLFFGTTSIIVNQGSGSSFHWYNANPDGTYYEGVDVTTDQLGSGDTSQANWGVCMDGKTFSVSGHGPCSLVSYTEAGSLIGSEVIDATLNSSNAWMATSDTGHIYVIDSQPSNSRMWQFNPTDLSLVKYWAAGELAGTELDTGIEGNNFFVYKGQVCFTKKVGAIYTIHLVNIGAAPGYVLTDDNSHSLTQGLTSDRIAHLSGGLCVNLNHGVFSLDPPLENVLLSKIVGDLSNMTPVRGAFDVTELIDEVRWFVIGSAMTVRNAIQSLRQAFFFDAVESDYVAKFRKRSEVAVFEIPDTSLCGREYGEESGDPLRTIRTREQELPRTVAFTYIDVDTDYQTGVQSTPRQTTLSEQDVAIEVPIGFNASEAMQKCWTLINGAWVERENFEWSTTRGGHVIDLVNVGSTFPAAQLEPCDVGIVRGRVIRIKTRVESPNGVIKWTGVLAAPSRYTSDDASIYIQPSVGTPSDGFVSPTPPGPKADTDMVLLDLPLINDTDYPNGFYVAVAKSATAVPASTTLPPGTITLPWPYTGNTRTYLTAADGTDPGDTVTMGFITPNVIGARALIAAVETSGSFAHMHRWTLTKVGGAVVTQFFSQGTSISVVTGASVTSAFTITPNAAYTLTAESINTDLTPSGTAGVNDFHVNFNHISSGSSTPGGSWTGAEVYKSSDGGTNYASVGSSTTADIIGTVSTALGDWLGGNNFDESHIITVTLGAGSGTLSSVSEAAVLNGSNEFALGTVNGWEIIQFKTANLITTGVYQLSGLLRGRRGTEWMIGLHVGNETFVMLPVSINVNAPFSELGAARLYKGVSYGTTLASTTPQTFTNTGVALKPYAPVSAEGGREANGDLTLECIPRTRTRGVWLDNVDVTLSDPDTYKWQLYTDGTYTTVATSDLSTGPTITFTLAELNAAFSPLPSTFYFDVAQSGLYGFGYAARGSVRAGIGANDEIVEPGMGSIVIDGQDPFVLAPITPQPGVGSIVIAGVAPSLSLTGFVTAQPSAGSIIIAGLAPSLSAATVIQPSIGSIIITGETPTAAVSTSGVTWNPSDKGSAITLSGGNLTATSSGANHAVRGTTSHSTGKYYFELVWDTVVDANNSPIGGIADGTLSLTAGSVISYTGSGSFATIQSFQSYTYKNGAAGGPLAFTGVFFRFNSGDVANVAVDLTAGKIWFGRNGQFALSGNPGAGTNETWSGLTSTSYFPAVSIATTAQCTARFSSASWGYSAPSGFGEW